MANWSDLKNAVNSVIKTNGNQEITGKVLQDVLNNIISNIGLNSSFAGIATPVTNPGTPDGNVFYIATTAGIYSNFNGIVVNSGEAVILEWKGSWVKKDSGFATNEKLSELGSKELNVIDYDNVVKSINHRGFNTVAPENTIPAYILSRKKGYKYVECDVSFTKDGVAVLLHDSTIDRTSDGSGNINSLTYEQCLQYDFGSWKSSKYVGTKIPTFKEFIILCKRLGLHPYIELKNSATYSAEQIQSIVREVYNAGMKGKVTYISFNDVYLSYVKQYDAYARLGYVVNPSGGFNSSHVQTCVNLKSDTNEVFLDARHMVGYLDVTEEKVQMCIDANIPLEIWSTNDVNIILEMSNYISGVTTDELNAGKILYESALGDETDTETNIPATKIELSSSSLIFDSDEPQTLIATIYPSNSTDAIVWSSSDNSVATVSNGVVTAKSNGTAIITAKAGSVVAECNVVVSGFSTPDVPDVPEEDDISISLSDSSILIDGQDSYTLVAIVNPSTQQNNIIWNSSDESIATVNNGVVTPIDNGKVIITASIGEVSANCIVTIKNTVSVDVPDGYTLVRHITDGEIVYGVSSSGTHNSVVNNVGETLPYTASNAGRAGYYYLDIPVEPNKKYKCLLNSTSDTAQLAVHLWTEDAETYYDNFNETTQDITTKIKDSGWQQSGYEFSVPEMFNNSIVKYIRLVFRKDTSNSVISKGDIISLTILEILPPASKLPFELTGNDFVQGAIRQDLYPYISTNTTRCCITNTLDYTVEGGTVTFESFDINDNPLSTAIQTFGDDGLTIYEAQKNMVNYLADSTWKNNYDTHEIPEGDFYAWIVVRRPDNTDITPSEIKSVVIRKVSN